MTSKMTVWGSTEEGPLGLTPDSFLPFRVASVLWKIYPPFAVLLGVFGNVMSIVIMSRMTSGESTVNIFFIVIAVGDLLVLISGMTLSTWLETMFGLPNISRWPLFLWLVPAAGAFVSWMLVCVTLQRVLSVVMPHRVGTICTRRRVTLLITGVTLFLAALYSHSLYCFSYLDAESDSHAECIASNPDYGWFLDNVFSYVDMVIYSLLPFVSVVQGNAVLVWKLAASVRKARQRLTSAPPQELSKRSQTSTSVTITVCVVSLAFVLLTLPSGMFYVLYYAKDMSTLTPEQEADVYLFFTLSFLLADTNSAVNFYLYCLTGRRFREEFVRLVFCRKTTTSLVASRETSTQATNVATHNPQSA
ncbi:hypothetical protein ACOMHN_038308 [Nucella lapillus]